MFHITPATNLQSILNKGLLPGYRKGLTTQQEHSAVWLTDDVEYVLYKQAGMHWIKKYKPIVFEIDTIELVVEQYMARCYETPQICPHEFFVVGSIATKFIRIQHPT